MFKTARVLFSFRCQGYGKSSKLQQWKEESFALNLTRRYRHSVTLRDKADGDTCLVLSVNSKWLSFPLPWLRDNCQCSECYHRNSFSRKILLDTFHPDISYQSVQTDDGGQTLRIVWSNQHVSEFKLDWLLKRNFSPDVQKEQLNFIKRPEVTWGPTDFAAATRPTFDDLMASEECLYHFLENLETYGVVLIEGAPCRPGLLRNFVERFSFIRRTHYGEIFTIIDKADTHNVAYTNDLLQLHTDLPYYEYMPGVNLLHCIKQDPSAGGRSWLLDGLKAANKLKATNPEAFQVLSSTQVTWSDEGRDVEGEFYKLHRSPVICLAEGIVTRINLSQPQRSSVFTVTCDEATRWYSALRQFSEVLTDPEVMVDFKLKEGDILAFSNIRVIHGRSKVGTSRGRHLEGSYVDWDEVRSTRRVLQKKLRKGFTH